MFSADVKPEIFRACDIRGIVGKTLTKEVAYLIGRSFGSLALQKNQTRVVVARDGRLSGKMLVDALSSGLTESGCDVMDVGQVPTPVLYFATHEFNTGTGIMVTGSHNPSDYNGFKMMLAGDTLAEDQIQTLYQIIQTQAFSTGKGQIQSNEIIDNYIEKIKNNITLTRPLKMVIDCGNGVAGVLAEKLYTALGCEVVPLFCEVDGHFPNHHPDPGQPHNLQDLIHLVKKEKADLGIAFDGDGDRLGIVTNEGEIIWPDRLMMLFSQDLLSRKPGSRIIFDVKCSKHLEDRIRQFGGEPIMYKTGHALIKRKMKEVDAQLSGEMSGHFFFKERWYGFDDACYAGARLLEIFSKEPTTVSMADVFRTLPDSVNTPEINISIAEDKKFSFIEEFKKSQAFQDANIITVDGIRVEFGDGWGLVRASNTTPCLVLRFEALDEMALTRIQTHFKEVITQIAPELKLSF